MTTSRRDDSEATEPEHTVVDAKIERTEQVAYAADEPERTSPGVPPPPPTTSGSARWQPRRTTGESSRGPTVSVAAAAPAIAPHAANRAPAAARRPTPTVPPPFDGFDDERPQALTFSAMLENDAKTAAAHIKVWLAIALAWLKPRAQTGGRWMVAAGVRAWQRLRVAVKTAQRGPRGRAPLDLEAESSDLADRGRAKKWDQFRQGKQSAGYLKDDK